MIVNSTVGLEIAKFVKNFDLKNVPEQTIEKAKSCILDTLSVGIGGSDSREANIIEKVFLEQGGNEQATVFNRDFKLSAPNAALVNATMTHSLELDDTDRFTYYHPGTPVIIAALALAELTKCSGKRFLESVILGYEVSIRIAEAVNPSHRNLGFHTTGTVGTFGAGIASAKILNLNEDQVIHALGISGTQAAGLFEFLSDGSMTKRLHPGKSAWNGIVAAQLAEKGLTGPATILEGEHGFLRAMGKQYDINPLTAGFGEEYKIDRVGFKRHAACRYCHAAIDASLEIISENPIDIEQIKQVEVLASTRCVDQTGSHNASTLMAAQFSTPYATALSIIYGDAGIDTYQAGLANEKVLTLMKKVKVTSEEEFGDYGRQTIVKIKMNDGQLLEQRVNLPKGEPETPLTLEELKEKSHQLCEEKIGLTKTNQLIDTIFRLERENDVTVMTEYLN